jgi:transposase
MKIKSYSKSELAAAYGVSLVTLNKWICEINNLELQKNCRIFTPKQVSIIVQHLGEPED